MSSWHTPGRLSTDCAEHDAPYQNINLQIGSRTVATVWIDDAPVHDFNAEQIANARRLVACWNACNGVPTELLEAYPAPFSQLRAQRDELLEALKLADCLLSGANMNREAVERKVRAAIAKATGGAL